MAAELLQGIGLAREMNNGVAQRVGGIAELGESVCFTTVIVGTDPGSERYTQAQMNQGRDLGFGMDRLDLPANVSQAGLEDSIAALSEDPTVHAVLLQHPLPSGLDYLGAISELDPSKDADGMHPTNLGLLLHDRNTAERPSLFPCTPKAIVTLLGHSGVELAGAHVAVVGRGKTVGVPLNILLGSRNNGPGATVSSIDHRTRNPEELICHADVVVGAAGARDCVKDVNPGATLIAVGATYIDGVAYSDFAPEAERKAGLFAPVKGGIGPVTRAVLWSNVEVCFGKQHPDVVLAAQRMDLARV